MPKKTATDTKRELNWEGKYDVAGQLNGILLPDPPLKLIKKESYSSFVSSENDNASNQLIHGDNKLVMSSLLEQFEGKIDLIYIDPPFDVGARFDMNVSLGDKSKDGASEQKNLKTTAYDDRWGSGIDSYLQSLFERLTLMHKLLADSGSIYVHCDWRANSYIRLIMDSIFGAENFLNEIVWLYGLGGSSHRNWSRKHDTILFYSKTVDGHYFNPVMVPATSQRMKGMDKKCPDFWNIPTINNQALERTGYATQKPEQLLERIITASSRKGDLVADFYCGSGTTGVVASKLGRRWTMSDSGQMAIHTTRKRMIDINGSDGSDFDIYDFGSADRKWLQTEKLQLTDQQFIKIVLEGFKADVLESSESLSSLVHGKKGDIWCHVSSLGNKLDEQTINQIIEDVRKTELMSCYCLASEFEVDINRTVEKTEKGQDVKLTPVRIPSDILVQISSSSIVWFGLHQISINLIYGNSDDGSYVDIKLTGFQPNLISAPEKQLNEFQNVADNNAFDLIDFWSVDFDYEPYHAFKHHWSSYRTRKERGLALSSDIKYRYPKQGQYIICVMLVDVFGNETYTTTEIES